MKTVIKYFFVIISFGIFVQCSTGPDEQYRDYLVKVDKIRHPDTVSVNDTIRIKLDGFIGNNGCHHFSRFEADTRPLQLDLKVWARAESSKEMACAEVMVYLYGREYAAPAKERGTFRIIIHQPDGSILSDSVIVR